MADFARINGACIEKFAIFVQLTDIDIISPYHFAQALQLYGKAHGFTLQIFRNINAVLHLIFAGFNCFKNYSVSSFAYDEFPIPGFPVFRVLQGLGK